MPLSRSNSYVWLLGLAMPFILSVGCNVLVGIEDKELAGTGGAGSSSSSSSGESSSGSGSTSTSGSSSSSSGGVNSCPAPWPRSMMCIGSNVCPSELAQVTDPCHCGGCFIDCGDGVGCGVGRCATRPLADVPNRNIHITASNGAKLFLAAFNEGDSTTDILEIPLGGAPMSNVIATVKGSVDAMAADCENVYFSTVPDSMNGENAVWYLPLMGGMDMQTVPAPPDEWGGEFKTIVLDKSGNMYWTDGRGVGIWSIGAGTSVRVTGMNADIKANGLAVDDRGMSKDVYWTNYDTGTSTGRIMHVAMTGSTPGTPETMIEGQDIAPRQLGIDAVALYWVDVATAPYRVQRTSRAMPWAPNQMYKGPMVQGEKIGDTIAVDWNVPFVYVIQGIDGDPRVFRIPKVMMPGMMPQPITPPMDGIREGWLSIGSGRLFLASSKNGPMGNEGFAHSITIHGMTP